MEQCENMRETATFLPLILLLSYFWLISLIILPLMIFLMIRIWRNQLYHLNTRIILIVHCIGIFVHCADRVVLHSSDLYRWLIVLPQSVSPCDIVSSSERCFSLRLMLNIGMFVSICTTPTLVIERILATLKISSYQENRTAWVWLLLFQIILSSIFLSLIYAETTFGGVTIYCIAAKSSIPVKMLVAFFSITVVQTISILGFRYSIYTNKKLKLSILGANLLKRYQVEESLRSLTIISLPLHTMYIFQFAHSCASFFVLNYNSLMPRRWYYFWMEVSAFVPEYAIVFMIAFYLQEKRIERMGTSSIKREIHLKTTENYFEQYKKIWTI